MKDGIGLLQGKYIMALSKCLLRIHILRVNKFGQLSIEPYISSQNPTAPPCKVLLLMTDILRDFIYQHMPKPSEFW